MRRIASPLSPASRSRQSGAALLTAMVIVTVVASLSVAMVWQQWRAVQVETAERARAQSYWLLAGSRDWARLILGEDDSSIDHLGEPWATPLAETRLSTFLAADRKTGEAASNEEGIEAFLSGTMVDLQSRYNLRNLIDANSGQANPLEFETLTRLCELAKVPNGTAEAISEGMRLAQGSQNPQAPQPSGQPTSASAPRPKKVDKNEALVAPITVDDLAWFGLTKATVAQLRPFVTLLPKSTPININTAPREVMVAVIKNLDQGLAQRIIQTRQQEPFRSTADIKKVAPSLVDADLSAHRVDVKTTYFEITGRLRLENQVIEERAVILRPYIPGGRKDRQGVRTLYSERISSVLGETNGNAQ